MTDAIVLRRALGLRHLIAFGLSSMAPVSAFTVYGFIFAVSGGAVVSSYVVGAAGLVLTALSFAQMAEVMPNAGSAYGYVGLAMGRATGMLAAWAMLLDYTILAALTVLFGAIYLAGALPGIPAEALIAVISVIALWTGVGGVMLSARVNLLVLAVQVALIVVFAVLALPDLPAQVSAAPALPGTVIAGAAMAVISYLGFDAISTLAEEVDSPRPGRLVGIATVVCVLVMLVLCIGVSALLSRQLPGVVTSDPSMTAFDVVATRLPVLALPLGLVAGVAIGLGANLACHTGASRLVFALARGGHLPGALARLHPRWRTPWLAVLAVWAIFTAGAYLALPHAEVLGGLVSFGALTGFALVNLAVLVHFGIRQGSRRWLAHWLLPALGCATMLYILSGLGRTALILGALWLALGAAIALVTRRG